MIFFQSAIDTAKEEFENDNQDSQVLAEMESCAVCDCCLD